MNEDRARDLIIESARQAAWWWSTQVEGRSTKECIEGALFTFLSSLDGCGDLPSCDIIMLHSDYDGNTVAETRVSTMLHEFFYERKEPGKPEPLISPSPMRPFPGDES